MVTLIWTQLEANAIIREHGLADDGWHFNFDNARSRGGLCDHTFKRISLSRYLVPNWTEDETRQIILHEVAHALAGHGHGHDAFWLRTARNIGYRGGRTHSLKTVTRPWLQVCPTHGTVGKAHRRTKNLACGLCYKYKGMMVPITFERNPELDRALAAR